MRELSLPSPINPEYPHRPPLLNWMQLTGLVKTIADVVGDSFADDCVLGPAGFGRVVKLGQRLKKMSAKYNQLTHKVNLPKQINGHAAVSMTEKTS